MLSKQYIELLQKYNNDVTSKSPKKANLLDKKYRLKNMTINTLFFQGCDYILYSVEANSRPQKQKILVILFSVLSSPNCLLLSKAQTTKNQLKFYKRTFC